MRISSLISDVESLLNLSPEDLGCALLKVINSLPEGMQHRHNYLLMPEATDGYPPQLHERAKQSQSDAWEWLRYKGYIAPRVGSASSDFIYVTELGKKFLEACDKATPFPNATATNVQSVVTDAVPGEQNEASSYAASGPPENIQDANPQHVPGNALPAPPSPVSDQRESVPFAGTVFTPRCERDLVTAAGYTRNRRVPQTNSLTTTAIIYALIDFALLRQLDADDATGSIGNAVRKASVDDYQSRRQTFLKQEVPVGIFDQEPLSLALTNVSANTRTLLDQAQEIAKGRQRSLHRQNLQPSPSIHGISSVRCLRPFRARDGNRVSCNSYRSSAFAFPILRDLYMTSSANTLLPSTSWTNGPESLAFCHPAWCRMRTENPRLLASPLWLAISLTRPPGPLTISGLQVTSRPYVP